MRHEKVVTYEEQAFRNTIADNQELKFSFFA